MSLTAVLEKLYARRRFGIRPGVDRVCTLLGRLGNPEKSFRTIHLVGTNGKGSTAAFLSTILMLADHKVGQFSSPHLVRFTERFRINGTEYPAEKLATHLDTVLAAAPDDATFFEITTALAAYMFHAERIELAVMEAGMGGRSDATAALPGIATIITPISLDHTDYLGATLGEIATEKSGIIEPGTPVITARQPDAVATVLSSYCREHGCQLAGLDKEFSIQRGVDGSVAYRGIRASFTRLFPGIPGNYQAGNVAVALAAAEILETLGIAIPPAAFPAGIERACWPGRMELIEGTPPLLLDGAHNPAGAAALAEGLQEYRRNRLLLVTGVCNDKDAAALYQPLLPLADAIYTVTPAVERALTDQKLTELFRTQGFASQPCGSVTAGIAAARRTASADDLILVCGSLFLVGEVKAWLEQADYTGIRG